MMDKKTLHEIEYNPNTNKKSFAMLALEQFERLILFSNVEFRGGFYMIAQDSKGMAKEIYVPDSRDVFCNCCFSLALLMKPKFTKPMEAAYASIIEKLNAIKKDFIDKSSEDEDVILGESFYDNEKDKILLEQYKQKRLNIFLRLYSEISLEMQRHKYFQLIGGDD